MFNPGVFFYYSLVGNRYGFSPQEISEGQGVIGNSSDECCWVVPIGYCLANDLVLTRF